MRLEEKRTMTKAKKQFSPHIFAEWGELFEPLSVEQKAELLMAITKFPNYEPANVPIWAFIKSQLVKDYEIFIEKCNKNGQVSRDYWNKKNPNDTERLPNDTERLPNDTERHPKRITNNDITNNDITNNDITEPKKTTKVLDPFYSTEVNEFFALVKEYANNQYNDLSPNRLLVAQMLPKISLDMEIWKQVLKRSRSMGHKINGEFKPLSLKNMFEHYSEILDGTYGLVNKWE